MTEPIEQLDATEPAQIEAPEPPEQAAAPIDPAALQRQIEAVLMSIERPITVARLGEIVGVPQAKPVTDAIKALNNFYDQHDRAFRVEQVAGGLQILTLPQYRDLIGSMHKVKDETKLSPSALETLAIVAYKQPILRADIETIRGVSCGEMLRTLMDRHLVKIVGRAEEIGRPMLYGTTKNFLQVFGLASLKDLPNAAELQKP